MAPRRTRSSSKASGLLGPAGPVAKYNEIIWLAYGAMVTVACGLSYNPPILRTVFIQMCTFGGLLGGGPAFASALTATGIQGGMFACGMFGIALAFLGASGLVPKISADAATAQLAGGAWFVLSSYVMYNHAQSSPCSMFWIAHNLVMGLLGLKWGLKM